MKIANNNNFLEYSFVNAVKAYAILSVICAHVSGSGSGSYPKTDLVISALGTIGVIVFFIISGYFYGKDESSFKIFFKKKIRIIVPWFFCGILIYIISSFVGSKIESIQLDKLLLFLLGYYSYLYYLSMLFFCYLFFFNTKKSNNFLILSVFITIISVLLTAFNMLYFTQPYINPFNWIGFFALGILMQKASSLEKILFFFTKYKLLFLIIFFFSLIASVIAGKASYWTIFSIPIEISASALIFVISASNFSKNTIIQFVGKQSFAIYLLHMPLAGFINIIFNNYPVFNSGIIKPFIVLFVVALFIYLLSATAKKLKAYNILEFLIGTK